jgi:hypothetical protein
MEARNKTFAKHQSVCMPLDDLWQSVEDMRNKKAQFWINLTRSLTETGMDNPLIVVKCNLGELWDQKSKYKERILEVPGDANPEISVPPHGTTMYVIWGGSNRYSALKEMGYTHCDCIIIDGFQEGFTIQAQMRNGYNWLAAKKEATK